MWFKLKVKESWWVKGAIVTLHIEKGEDETWRYDWIRKVFEQLYELGKVCDAGTWRRLASQLEALVRREREIARIAAALNGPGHESLEDAGQLVVRIEELQSHPL